jgi:hypothetical protein
MIVSGYWSFTQFNGVKPPEWVGLDNYAELVSNTRFQKAVVNTFLNRPDLSAISAGLAAGYRREDSARFSFLLSTPVIAGAALHKVHHITFQGHAAWGCIRRHASVPRWWVTLPFAS